MAIPCTGITVTWNSVPFKEVRDIKITGPGSLPLARTSTWTLDLGTIEIQCLGTANVSATQYGKRHVLQITANHPPGIGQLTGTGASPGVAWTSDCIYESFQFQGTVNDVARYAVKFRVMDTTGAGSSP